MENSSIHKVLQETFYTQIYQIGSFAPSGSFLVFLAFSYFAEAFDCTFLTCRTDDRICHVCTLLHLHGNSYSLLSTSGPYNVFWESAFLKFMLYVLPFLF